MITIEQLKDIKERTEALNRYLDIEGKKIQVEEEQLRTQAPGFWDDQKAAEAQMKKVKGLQQWISGYNEVKVMADELQLAFDFYKDELVTEEEVDEAYAKASAAVEALELKSRPDGLCTENKFGSRRHGEPGLGEHADAYVSAICRNTRI